ncbi:hypothetical protein AALP_AA8G332700 [Arabis alpina]|uniref:Midasin n=1 Tax=Arabis alpina TaxID=50452 RepID=A0A087GB38_ARAAL|nr:hypothetical protein AALP_AA8G332700 [Arabis alpina]
MAIDGSFSLQLAFETFSERCPKVAALPSFISIINKGGDVVVHEEVINALSDVFLHPEYTIPLVHCFLPIITSVVDRVVGLLHLVGDLSSSTDYSVLESAMKECHLVGDGSLLENAMKEGVSVIDFYVRRGQRLELHECACLAFSRALHFNTTLLSSILSYFKEAPPPYQRILVKEISSESHMEAITAEYLLCLQVSYRFLVIRPEVFSKLWDWSSYLDSMERLSDCPKPEKAVSEKHREAVWCGIQILSLVLRHSVAGSCGFEGEEALSCLLRWEEFCQDIEIEKAGLYIQLPTYMGLRSLQQFSTPVPGIHKRQSAEKEPSIKIRRLDTWDVKSFSEPFEIHSRVKKSFEMVSLAVSQKRPVLLYGPSGSGKSALIRKLADESGNQVVFIHMDDQLDGKTLVGTYVCTDQPGEFKWQPGSLTQAIMNGFWVVLEDIDKAPSDVPLVLSPLLGGSCSFETSHGEQSDIVDLLGGFKPIDAKLMCTMLYNEFNELARDLKMKDDSKIMKWLQKNFRAKKWDTFLSGLKKTTDYHYEGKTWEERSGSGRKRKKLEQIENWMRLSKKVEKIHQQICSGGMVFTFVEGAFVTALREGHWVLLDEVNLAPPEILGRLVGVLEGVRGSLCLAERGDVMGIPRHSNFRLFACMNPATDAGKRDLPFSFRSRFTEYAVDDDLCDDDLEIFVRRFLGGRESDSKLVGNIVSFYKEAKRLSEECLQDGANQKPQYSLRSLYRALEYAIKAEGKLVFHEGALVKAVRDGHWIVLDELNLAPSDVLEALNRLLDDNRELFVPELQETISAHPNFMLFATQNPPALYGGRKILSRAFRNRFVEIHVDEIPEDELSEILTEKCLIAKSYATKMVEVMKDLQRNRQSSKAFAGKHGYITPRDLFRWADRFRTYEGKSNEELAREGYYLLAERLRDDTEKLVVKEVLERHFRVSLAKDDLYKEEFLKLDQSFHYRKDSMKNRTITWTQSMWRLFFLIERSYKLREPVLLVGDTGGGKTTICQLLSDYKELRLHILNCHQYTETSDFLGGFFPVRDRSKLVTEYENQVNQLNHSEILAPFGQDIDLSADIGRAEVLIKSIDAILEKYKNDSLIGVAVTLQNVDVLEQIRNNMVMLYQKWRAIFVWQDGPLVEAMRAGNIFLVDEISLADDSVLERLNSVLEPGRKLSLAEKGGPVLEEVVAHENFFVLATMNPGGDYGKKELSPALRNRFTEIWVPPIAETEELRSIAVSGLSNSEESNIVDPIINFWEWFNGLQTGRTLTVRDLLSWVTFVNVISKSLGPAYAILHGAFLVLLDGLSLGTGFSGRDGKDVREKCFAFLLQQVKVLTSDTHPLELSRMEQYGWGDAKAIWQESKSVLHGDMFGIYPFYISKGDENPEIGGFEFLAPTTCRNVLRVLRAMQLSKPILLEEQTDMMDLLGSDLPVESDEDMKFAWSDGILLQALKEGSWVLLDELNLAPQSVLEGLNAILDHRAQVFIPELGCTFECPPTFRVFACQNPSSQGGGRKGLPKSFLNRFTKVYVDELVEDDYLFICRSLHPSIPSSLLSKLITLNRQLHDGTMVYRKFGHDGSPWEFNLRDVIRSCQFMQGDINNVELESFLNVLYVQRMRTATDRQEVLSIYKAIFDKTPFINPYPRVQLNPGYLVVGTAAIKRNLTQSNISRHSSSGKTSVIRILAQLTGFHLNEINLSSATDSSDLLGCFEQYNAFRNFRLVVARVEHLVDEYNSLLSQSSQAALLSKRKGLVSSWLSLLYKIDSCRLESPSSSYDSDSLSVLSEIVKALKQILEKGLFPVSWSKKNLDQIMKTILKLQTHEKKQSAKFEWVTGMLIKAIENGEWVVLENANLCNPTVLDRINSLVEPSGSITINECGIIDGEPVTVTPHPNFRLFLSVNPKFGEVSRAMRNRGVEVFMMGPHWQRNEVVSNSEELVLRDVERFLALSGIPGYKLVASMAKAHVHAWRNGQTFGVRITYLELEQWVHLFKLLLMNGNQLLWSLQLSWEHIYLSSLGVTDGKEVIDLGRDTYLSDIELSELDSFTGGGLYLPGGWPKPFNLRDLMWYSRETTVRQNCMYLEFLGAQYASHHSEISYNAKLRDRGLAAGEPRIIYTINSWTLKKILFPQASIGSTPAANLENDLASKKLLYAANWTMEQATEKDIELYLGWISWFGSRLQQYCPFFLCFLNLLNDERKHRIWNQISTYREKLKSLWDPDAVPIPMMSSKLIDIAASNDQSKPYCKPLFESLSSVGVLRLSYQQWSAESNYNQTDVSSFIRFLDSLRALEKKILYEIVGSPSFSVQIQLYAEVIEKHSCLWSDLVLSSDEYLLFSFWSLIKAVKKLHSYFPEEVQVVLEESKNINKIALHGDPEKSLLWAYGGHPSLPASAELYHKQQEFLQLCSTVWPLKSELDEQGNDHLTKAIAFSGPELCLLALEGLCISSYIADKDDEDYVAAVQLDEIYQTFLGRLKLEKKRLEDRMGSSEIENKSAVCCVLRPEIVATGFGFNSWVKICSIASSESSSLDVELLAVLQKLVVAQSTEHKDLVDVRKLLKPALEYSLSTTRPPQTLVAHQKLLWAIDARASVPGVDTKIAGFVLEMWYWWHSVLWKNSQIGLMGLQSMSEIGNSRILSPSMLIQPVKTATVDQILENAFPVKDYPVQSVKFLSVSRFLWKSSQPYQEMPGSLLSIARSLFQQMIYTHQKSFEPEIFEAIKSAFHAMEKKQNKMEGIQFLISQIGSSSHQRLKSVTHSCVSPLAICLYSECSSDEFYANLGLAWIYLGGLRFHLLNGLDVIDPAMKISCKLLVLDEKISSLELNINVREECEYVSGLLYTENNVERTEHKLSMLKTERKRLQRKVIFRSDPKKYQDLRRALDEFAGFLRRPIGLVHDIKVLDWNQVVEQVFNWQETATSFIDRLSNDYSEYVDITQPIQVSVYEMKLGLSLSVSGALLGKVLNKFDIDMVDSVMETINALMRFPRGSSLASTTYIKSLPPLQLSHDADSHAKSLGLDVGLLHKLISVSSEEDSRKVSELQLKIALYKNLHARVLHFVANTGLMDKASFEILDKMYLELARNWMEMKFQVKTKAEALSGLYKFRTRDFKIENVMEVDISALAKYFPNDSFSEWQDYLADDDVKLVTQTDQDEENLEGDWDLIQEHLDNIYSTHNELFGFCDLSEKSVRFCITDSRRLDSFTDSYELGVNMIKGLKGLFTSSLDAKLVPEHLLRLCLEYKKTFTSCDQFASKYNFYKDVNGPEMGKMVKFLTALQRKIHSLLQEQEEHPGLQKLSDVLQMLLDIPSSTPLAKALSGLQFLLCKIQQLQEEGCKLPISELLEPIISLASSWQKVEFERWPTLLDEVQDQYELNARKLWLPLFSVLFQKDCVEISELENESISQSLVEFIETSNIGEFWSRLQLLFCFLLQLSMGSSLGIYSSDSHKRKVEICYNIFGFYIQFLPVVMKQLGKNRENVEDELKQVLKLCRWERPDNYLSIESTRRTRQKVKKLIQKFTDMLRLPVVLSSPTLTKERAQCLPLIGSDLMNGASDMSIKVLVSDLDAEQLNDRFSWYAVWRDKMKELVGSFHQDLLTGEERQYSSPVYQGDWKNLWSTVATIGERIAGCSDLWRNNDRDVAKKRALPALLKLLEDSGLQKHKFENVEMSNHFKGLLYQPAYDPNHLLLLTHTKSSIHPSRVVEDQNKESSLVEWRDANEFYFKSLASVQIVLNIDRKHSDVTSEQVKRSISFLNHLVDIQRRQRKTAYGFAELLNRLRQRVLSLAKLLGDSVEGNRKDDSALSFPQNQHAVFNCMWLQKKLFDNITAMLLEELALLRTIGSTHLDSCQSVKASSRSLLSLIEKLILIAQNSKASLDRLLLDSNGFTITPSSCLNQFVTQDMVQLLRLNFNQLRDLENRISTFCDDNEKSYARDVLLSHFSPVFKEGQLLAENLNGLLKMGDQSTGMEPKEFEENLASTFANVKDVIGKLCSYKDGSVSQEEETNITTWDGLFKKAQKDLNLDNLCKLLSETFGSIGQLLNSSGVLSACVGDQLKQLQAFLDLLLSFCDCYLKDFLAMSKTVSLITHVLAIVLADLFAKGFGISKNDEDDGSKADKSKDEKGTGMGNGKGAKDVSDQIEDEEQLHGTDEKEEDEKEQDTPDDVLGKDKGIEMSEEFDGKEYSVSEDSEEDKEDEENEVEQLDTAFGEVGADAEKADEKPWDKDEDEESENMNEKNESGPSVNDKDTSSTELRAKDDDVDTADEPEESNNSDKPEEGDNENANQDDFGEAENLDDKIQNKEEALADPPRLTPDVSNGQIDDEMEIDETDEVEKEDADQQEEPSPEDQNHPEEGENDQEMQEPAGETMEDRAEDLSESPQNEDPGIDLEQKSETEPIQGKETLSKDMEPNFCNDNISGVDSGSQNPHGSNGLGAGSTAPQENLSATNVSDELTDSVDLPSGSNTEMNPTMTNLASGETLTDNIAKMEFPQNQSSTSQQTKVNPYRNVGDALKEWKERVRVSSDLGEKQEAENEMEDPDAAEFAFASQFDKANSQALGPALPEQVNTNMREGETEEERLAANQDEVSPMDVDDVNQENKPVVQSKPSIRNSIAEPVKESDTDMTHQEKSPIQNFVDGDSRMDSTVSVDRTFLGEDACIPDWMVTEKDSENNEEDPDARSNAVVLWRRCELLTAKPSQELAEQLRLILEPTLASKLSGDYRTGKRINMKKVIPYIASHYRKDKIWLRRTKPNKRDYQVVIAVDDSSSMSEGGCGDFAIRALATVCRAMSQLEMGSLAVASFGKQGSIKMLHDFGQSFTTESGIKMVSGLTFKQENLIEDQPIFNLLRNMNEMLEKLASTSRQSYGSNPLQQLVLIIGDGKFHEREKLKRSVRKFHQQKRMVVYILLDNGKQSVLDLLNFDFSGTSNTLQKMAYMDSFPFPYYILLKDIEALPTTLGHVLRQWFELMQQSSRD